MLSLKPATADRACILVWKLGIATGERVEIVIDRSNSEIGRFGTSSKPSIADTPKTTTLGATTN